jgi:RNA polymerase sigma-70 factor (ECF subfamily)
VAIANIRGPKAGLQAVRRVRDLNKLDSYYLLYAVLGEFEMQSGNLQVAAEQFRKSFELADTKSERAFLLKRLQRCVDGQTI